MAGQWINPIDQGEWSQFYLATTRLKRWPVANDDRRFQGFWFSNQRPFVAPMFSRIVSHHLIARGSENRLHAYFELESISENLASAVTPLNELGRRLSVELRNWPTPHPVFDEIGVSWDWLYHREGFADDVMFGIFNMPNTTQHEWTPHWFDWPFNRGVDDNLRTARAYSSWEPGQDTDFDPFEPPNRYIAFHAIPFGRSVPNNQDLSPYPAPAAVRGKSNRLLRRPLKDLVDARKKG